MIARLWKGWTSPGDADAYERVFRSEVLPELQGVDGYRGAYLLRRALPDGVEFAALTLFESLEAVRAFAGDDYEVAVISPAARRVLTRFDRTSQHFEVAVASEDKAP
jgi:heme-degrading monooxygenase HmoA